MRPGEIYLARFPFGDVPGMKLRPVLLLTGSLGSVPEVLVAYISSVLPVQPISSSIPRQRNFRGRISKSLRRCASTNSLLFICSSLSRHLGRLEPDQHAIRSEERRVG